MLKTDFHEASGFRDTPRTGALDRSWRFAALAGCGLCLLAVFARIMTYPMQHDEQFYIAAGVLFDRYPLYSGIGFSHLPNIALLFAGAFALLGDAHYLLIGRLLVFAAWAGTCAALLLIARSYVRSVPIGGLMFALLALNPMLLNATGMTATNNFLPVPFMLFGLYLFLRAADRDMPSPVLALASGFVLAWGPASRRTTCCSWSPLQPRRCWCREPCRSAAACSASRCRFWRAGSSAASRPFSMR